MRGEVEGLDLKAGLCRGVRRRMWLRFFRGAVKI